MSDQLRNLVIPVGEFDPPLDLHTRILERERELAGSRRLSWRPPRLLMIAVAAAGVALLLVVLALAAHSRTSAPGPAHGGGLPGHHPTLSFGPPQCAAGDMAISIELRRPHGQASGVFKVHSHRRAATIVVQNVSDRACSAAPAFTFRILDRLGRTIGSWDDQGSWFNGTYQPAGIRTFTLPAVYRCDRPGPFTAVARVDGKTVRRHNLNLSEITCP